jgi:S-adenosylmethionine hydrolase
LPEFARRVRGRAAVNTCDRLADRALELPFARTFSDVPAWKPLAFIDSRGRFSLAANQGDFSKAYEVRPPCPLVIYRKNR